jgi:hypothetical protein
LLPTLSDEYYTYQINNAEDRDLANDEILTARHR